MIKIALLVLFVGAVLTYRFANRDNSVLDRFRLEKNLQYALIGDIGGTNIRYQLISFYQSQ